MIVPDPAQGNRSKCGAWALGFNAQDDGPKAIPPSGFVNGPAKGFRWFLYSDRAAQ